MTRAADRPPDPPTTQPAERGLERVLAILSARSRPADEAVPMAGDVSRRRYVRLHLAAGGTAILALYPDDMRDVCSRSLYTGRLLHEHGVRVATVLDSECGHREPEKAAPGREPGSDDADQGTVPWTLLEDLGEETLYDLADRPWSEVEPYFEDAVRLLPRIASLPEGIVSELNPPLDRELLLRELGQTRELFLAPRGFDPEGRADDAAAWRRLEALCDRLGAEEPAPCHRDFGARNLIPLEVLPGGSSGADQGGPVRVGVVDHQDLRLGPPLYDLASLLNDSLFPPAETEERLLGLAGVRSSEDRERYHRTAAQRTLKAVGSYASFARRGDERHAPLIAPTMERALEHLARLPEAADAVPVLRRCAL